MHNFNETRSNIIFFLLNIKNPLNLLGDIQKCTHKCDNFLYFILDFWHQVSLNVIIFFLINCAAPIHTVRDRQCCNNTFSYMLICYKSLLCPWTIHICFRLYVNINVTLKYTFQQLLLLIIFWLLKHLRLRFSQIS